MIVTLEKVFKEINLPIKQENSPLAFFFLEGRSDRVTVIILNVFYVFGLKRGLLYWKKKTCGKVLQFEDYVLFGR